MIGRTDPQPAALRAFRERRGWTHEEMADVVHASPLEVQAWEAGTVRVPREQAEWIRVLSAVDARLAAVVAAPPPPCAWADRHAPDLHARLCLDPGAVETLDPATRSHVDLCPACRQARALPRRLQRVGAEAGLGSHPAESLLHGLIRLPAPAVYALAAAGVVAFCFVMYHLVGWVVPRTQEGSEARALQMALIAGGMAFCLAAAPLKGLFGRRPWRAGLLQAAAATLTGMLYWNVELRGPGLGAGQLALGAVVTLVLGALAGWAARATHPADEPDADATLSAALDAAPLLAPPAARPGAAAVPRPDREPGPTRRD